MRSDRIIFVKELACELCCIAAWVLWHLNRNQLNYKFPWPNWSVVLGVLNSINHYKIILITRTKLNWPRKKGLKCVAENQLRSITVIWIFSEFYKLEIMNGEYFISLVSCFRSMLFKFCLGNLIFSWGLFGKISYGSFLNSFCDK